MIQDQKIIRYLYVTDRIWLKIQYILFHAA